MSSLQPTGILARVAIYHEKGALLEATSLNARIKELGIVPSPFDGSTNLNADSELQLNGKTYKVINIKLQFLARLDSNRVPDIDPATYFSDTNEPLPMNLYIALTVRQI